MAGNDEDNQDDDIPLLEDIVRPGHGDAGGGNSSTDGSRQGPTSTRRDDLPLSDAEIEAIAARVVERHISSIEQAVARAIRAAVRLKRYPKPSGSGSSER